MWLELGVPVLISDEIAAFVRFVCIFWGLVYLVTQSVIFRLVRLVALRYLPNFAVMLYCASCAGFWIGLSLGHWYWPWSHGAAQVFEAAAASLALGAMWAAYFGNPNLWEYERKVVEIISPQAEADIAEAFMAQAAAHSVPEPDVSEGKL